MRKWFRLDIPAPEVKGGSQRIYKTMEWENVKCFSLTFLRDMDGKWKNGERANANTARVVSSCCLLEFSEVESDFMVFPGIFPCVI